MGSAGQYTGTCIKNRIYYMEYFIPNYDLVILQQVSLFFIELGVILSISSKTLKHLVIWLDFKGVTRYFSRPELHMIMPLTLKFDSQASK